jgi:6-phosphogluconolactonase (cycloisomerase 2 family)
VSQWRVYVGCFTQDLWNHFPRPDSDRTIPSDGIEHFLFDDRTGSLQAGGATGDLRSPQYLDRHPTIPVLYAAEFSRPGGLRSFAILEDGRLAPQTMVDSLGAMAVSVSVHPAGTVAYVSHLGDSRITTCPLDAKGGIRSSERIAPTSTDTSPSDGKFALFDYHGAGPKHHQVRVTPDGRALVATDVGCDQVVAYQLDEVGRVSPTPLARIHFPEGSAPRHIEFHPSGTTAYVVGEHDAMLYILEADGHIPRRIIGAHAIGPPDTKRKALPSELHLQPDGRTLFVGVRRLDSIAAFSVDGAGDATLMYHQPSLGRNPRAVRGDPTGRHLLVGNWESNNLVVFRVDDDNGLRAVGDPVEAHSPSSIVFVPAPAPT